MVGLVVVSHSARLADGVVELAREMAADVPIEAAGGVAPAAEGEEPGLGTDAARVMEAIEAADTGDGVLVLMDLGSAVLSAETALDLIDPDVAARVRLAAAPLVEGAVAAAVAAQAGQSLDEVASEAQGGLGPKAVHLGQAGEGAAGDEREAAVAERPEVHADAADVLEERFVVTVAQGLHARPAARFVRTASARDATIEVLNATTGAGPARAGSLNAIATLGVREGHEIVVRASGPNAAQAIEELRAVATEGAPVSPRAMAMPAGAPAGIAGDRSATVADTSLDAAVDARADTTAGTSATQPQAPPQPPAPGTPLHGIPSSPGIAIGPLRQLGQPPTPPPIDDLPAGDPDQEWAALGAARYAVRLEIEQRRARLAEQVGPEEAEILDALALVLDDEALLEPARDAIYSEGVSAARAWADAIGGMVERYRALDDPYQRARAGDLEDVGRRVLAALAAIRAADGVGEAGGEATTGGDGADAGRAAATTGATTGASDVVAAAILVAHELTPIDAAGLDAGTVAGIATATGGPTSHGAILARALGVPAVVGIGEAVLALADGAPAVLDGGAGVLVPEPSPDVTRDYAERREREQEREEEARGRAHEPAVTRDGVRVEVAANAGSAEDAQAAVAYGADGVGLFRTEFAFLDRPAAPTEDEQVEIYGAAAQALEGRTLIIRTLDAGADKPLPYLEMPAEENPFLGVRGLRLGLAQPELLRTQLRAIVRTAAAHENVKLMFPMVATLDELRAARALLDDALADVGEQPRSGFEVGIMVEVPAAALTAGLLAREVDFFSLGTNDLTQYVLAAERGNAALATLADGLHPAVLRLVDEVCRAADRHGRWVGVCGELGADPAAVPLLVGLGVRELSVAAPSVPAVKAGVRALDTGEAAELARAALDAESAAAVRALVVSDR